MYSHAWIFVMIYAWTALKNTWNYKITNKRTYECVPRVGLGGTILHFIVRDFLPESEKIKYSEFLKVVTLC